MNRIEMHTESSYSYKGDGSVITPKELLLKLKKEKIKNIVIIDYCCISSIPVFEKLKEEMNLNDLKIAYGISLNIKFYDLYVPSILIAKNNKGIKALYKLVSKMNEEDCYFILQKDLDEVKEDLILGITNFDIKECYEKVIDYYDYIEVTPYMKRNKVEYINDYCMEHNILLIATSTPKKINKNDYGYELLNKFDINKYFYNDKDMLDSFSYLNNSYDIVFNNSYKILKKIDDYNFDFNKNYMINVNSINEFKEDIYQRANLIYIDNIPKNVIKRLDYELNEIRKYNLEGTLYLLENLIHKSKKLGDYVTVEGYLSYSLVAYLLGLTIINPMDMKKQNSFINEKQKFKFYINSSKYIKNELICFYKRLIKNTYHKSYLTSHSFNKDIKKRITIIPNSYYIIPEDIDILDISPLNNNENVLDFSEELKNNFASLYFNSNILNDRLFLLEDKTNVFREDILFNDKKVIENMYTIINENDYKNYIDYNIDYSFTPKLKINKNINVKNIYDLINLYDENPYWISKVVNYYFDSYYLTYYEKEYYEVYLNQLINHFDKRHIFNNNFIKEFEKKYNNKTILDEINIEKDSIKKLIMKTLYIIYEKGVFK